MKTLTLWRHAKSSWADAGAVDHERVLNARGRRDAPVMAARLLNGHGCPDWVISSTAERTRATAGALLEQATKPLAIEYLDALYLADVPTLLETIAKTPASVGHLLVIGHNPGLADCATHLAAAVDDYMPTAALVVFEFDRPDFDLRDAAAPRLVRHDWPKRDRGDAS